MKWIKLFLIITLILLPAALIWFTNIPRKKRYQQYWSPCTALLFSLAASGLLYYGITLTQHPIIIKLINLLPANITNWVLNVKWILINSLFLYIFFFAKVLGILTNRTVRWLARITALRFRLTKLITRIGLDPVKMLGEKAETGSRSIAFAYVFVPGRGVYLKSEWIFASLFFTWISLIPCLLIITVLIMICFYPAAAIIKYVPDLPSMALIIAAEIALFLKGPRLQDMEGKMQGDGSQYEAIGKYEALFKEYMSTCPERILASGCLPPQDMLADGNDPKFCNGNMQVRHWCQHARSVGGEKRNESVDCWVYCSMVNDLLDGKNVLVTDPVHSDIAPFAFSAIYDFLADGRRILVIVTDTDSIPDTVQWIKDSLTKLGGIDGVWRIFSFDDCLRSQEEPDILVIDLGCVRSDPWFDLNESWVLKMDLIFFSEGLGLEPEQMASTRSLIGRLDDISPHPNQFLIFSKSYEGQEPWIRELIKAPLKEYNAGLPRTGKLYYMVWKTEGREDMQRTILPKLSTLFIGEELPLSLPALRAGVEVIRLIKQNTQPWHEYIEELKKRHQMLQEYGLTGAKAMGLDIYFDHGERNWQVPVEATSFMMIRDDEYNLVKTLVDWWSRGRNSCFINIVSPSYLLRDYLADNLDFFCQADHYVSAWTPSGIESRRATAYLLFKRLQRSYISEKELIELLIQTGVRFSTLHEGILSLLNDVLGSSYDFAAYWETRVRKVFNPHSRTFDQLTDYHLQGAECLDIQPEWFNIYEIIDETGQLLELVSANRADRTFLPGQLHAFAGKLYQVKNIDKLRYTVEMAFVDPSTGLRPALYRPKRLITIHSLGESESYKKSTVMGQWLVNHSIREANFEVRVDGYYCFEKGIDLVDEKQMYVDLTGHNEMTRIYTRGRVLEIKTRRTDGGICNNNGHVGFTLAAILQELLCTLYPHSFQSLAVGTKLPSDFFAKDVFSQRLKGFFQMLEGPDLRSSNDEISIYLLEDSEVELGILEVFMQRWTDLLRLMEDYLSWLLEEGVNLNSRYLCFGLEQIPEVFDLASLLHLLRNLPLGDLLGPVRRQARTQKKSPDVPECELACCDFCGQKFPSAQVGRLQDGRERCPECSRTAVNSLEYLRPLYQKARAFLIDTFAITLREEINISFNSAQEISNMSGLPFTATGDSDPRAVGMATQEETERGKKLAIYIENGAPAKSTLYTMVHELTHIWQFDNLDTRALTLDQIEGLSTWSEISCMERSGDREGANRYCYNLEQRKDEYWRGLQIVNEIAVWKDEYPHPFDFFQRNYPVSLF